MPGSIIDFWKLTVASGLVSVDRAKQLHAEFVAAAPTRQANAQDLAAWLVEHGALSPYQASELAAGRGSSFVFSGYAIRDVVDSARLAPAFRARTLNGQEVILVFSAGRAAIADDPQQASEDAGRAVAVDSPHVARVLQWVDEEPSFAVVENLHGQSLRELLATRSLPLEDACRFGFQAALGLVALHGQQILHGQLWPENLWLESSGTLKILQFPFVANVNQPRSITMPSADYLAPEMFHPRQPAGTLTDIYSLGCTLYELISGHVPFAGGGIQQKTHRHRHEVAARLDRLCEGVPEEIADLVAEMLDKEAMLRCESASHVAHRLAGFASGASRGPVLPPKRGAHSQPPGYGAWHAPAWQAPPKQSSTAQVRAASANSPSAAGQAAAPPAPARPERPSGQTSVSITSGAGGKSAAAADWTPPAQTPFSPNARKKRANQRTTDALLVAGGLSAILVLVVAIVGIMISRGESQPEDTSPASQEKSSPDNPTPRDVMQPALPSTEQPEPEAPGSGPPPSADVPSTRLTEAADDGRTLWESPTRGAPLDLAYLPSGAQLYLVVRPAELLSTAEGARLMAALGPGGRWAVDQLRAILGVELERVEQLAIALSGDEGAAQLAFTVRFDNQITREALLRAWDNPQSASYGGQDFYKGTHRAYWFPADKGGRLVAIASPQVMQSILDSLGRPPLAKGFARLARVADSSRHVNVLFVPKQLLTSGAALLSGELQSLGNPLLLRFDERLEGVLASMHLGEQLFLEVQALPPADMRAEELMALLLARVRALAGDAESRLSSIAPGRRGNELLQRLPKMLAVLAEYCRVGVEERVVVLRSVLPPAAAHNLLLAARLLLEQPAEAGAQAAVAFRADLPGTSDTDVLDRQISLRVERESLEQCLELIGKETGVDVEIRGADLKLEGITKNQTLTLEMRDRPARVVLGKVLELASPEGKLVYAMAPGPDGRQRIWVTTRSASAGQQRAGRTPAASKTRNESR